MPKRTPPALVRRHIAIKAKAGGREMIALELLIGGATYDQIARKMKYHDHSGARKAVKRALARVETQTADKAVETKMIILERNTRMIHTVWGKAIGTEAKGQPGSPDYEPAIPPDYRAIDRIVHIQNQLCDILGLYAPKELRHAGAGGGAIEVSDVRTKLAGLLAGVGPQDPANDSRETIIDALRGRA